MSTRSNIVIKKSSKNGSVKYRQMYHHCDGYPSGVGCELQEFVNEILAKSAAEQKEILSTPLSLAEYANEEDESYEIEKSTLSLHGDIEYLYVIDLNEQSITCYSVYNWSSQCSSDEDFVNGAANKVVKCDFSSNKYKEEVKVYASKFTDKWGDVEKTFDEDEISNEVEDEEEGIDYSTWEVSDLYQLVFERANVEDILNTVEGYVTKQDFKEILVELAKIVD